MHKKHVSEIMSTAVKTIAADKTLIDAIEMIITHNISMLPVVAPDGKLAGVLTEYDIVNFALSGNAAETKVSEAMSKTTVSFSPDSTVEEIMQCFLQQRIHRVPIVEKGKVVGVVSRRDLLKEILNFYK